MAPPDVVVRSLREQVVDYLKHRLHDGSLVPGAFLDLNAIAAEIGTSRTPLRDALLRLESEGFVEILSRRGVRVVELTLGRIRDIYELVGALESTALRNVAALVTPAVVSRMRQLCCEMDEALDASDGGAFYARNLEFHDAFIELSPNRELQRTAGTLRQRLYDFQSSADFLEEWERESNREHERIVELLEAGDIPAAADVIRDVHWSFAVQEPYIRRYYVMRAELPANGGRG